MTTDDVSKMRGQLLVDRNVQWPIVQRIMFYSAACTIYFLVVLFYTESMAAGEERWSDTVLRCIDVAVFWTPGLVLLIPVIAYDILSLTNRFAGPIYRLRRELKRLVKGEDAYPLNFRDGDFWTEIADDFNQIREELIELRNAPARDSSGSPEFAPRKKLFNEQPQPAPDEQAVTV